MGSVDSMDGESLRSTTFADPQTLIQMKAVSIFTKRLMIMMIMMMIMMIMMIEIEIKIK
jgi:hypothetical protein